MSLCFMIIYYIREVICIYQSLLFIVQFIGVDSSNRTIWNEIRFPFNQRVLSISFQLLLQALNLVFIFLFFNFNALIIITFDSLDYLSHLIVFLTQAFLDLITAFFHIVLNNVFRGLDVLMLDNSALLFKSFAFIFKHFNLLAFELEFDT